MGVAYAPGDHPQLGGDRGAHPQHCGDRAIHPRRCSDCNDCHVHWARMAVVNARSAVATTRSAVVTTCSAVTTVRSAVVKIPSFASKHSNDSSGEASTAGRYLCEHCQNTTDETIDLPQNGAVAYSWQCFYLERQTTKDLYLPLGVLSAWMRSVVSCATSYDRYSNS